jgi:hypothetical protein
MGGLAAKPVDALDRRTLRFVGSVDSAGGQALADAPSFDAAAASEVAVSDFRYVGSYSWTGEKSPTVLVPGKPLLRSTTGARRKLRNLVDRITKDLEECSTTFPTRKRSITEERQDCFC